MIQINFPQRHPNPLLEENRSSTANAVIKQKADFGVAFDGDFDRCFFFDHFGNFIPGEYMVGLLARYFLNKQRGRRSSTTHASSGTPLMLFKNLVASCSLEDRARFCKSRYENERCYLRWRDFSASLLQRFCLLRQGSFLGCWCRIPLGFQFLTIGVNL